MQFGLAEIWNSMGLVAKGVLGVLAIMSIVALAVAAERVLVAWRVRARSRAFSAKAQKLLDAGDFEGAASADPSHAGAVAQVVSAGLREYVSVSKSAPSIQETLAAVEAALERAGDGELARLKRGLGALATIGSIAPFVGLFGTIVGIVNAFQEIAKTGTGGLGAVSAGIAEALVTTAVGILVAVPAVVLFNQFTGGLEKAEAAMADASRALLDLVRKRAWTDSAASRGRPA